MSYRLNQQARETMWPLSSPAIAPGATPRTVLKQEFPTDRTSKGQKRAVAPSPGIQDMDQSSEGEEFSNASEEATLLTTKRAKSAGVPKVMRGTVQEQGYENGVLRKIVLKNFMNHDHLEVNLDPHVNFIVGKNGSGKSAILNSIIAGLGSKASATGRNLKTNKGLIKTGCDCATIEIHVANGGTDAYKKDLFGDTIVVITILDKQGANTYKMRNGANGPEHKVQKKEIDELCSHFNIQASNPCVILTQEHAKKFLHHGSEEDRYKFFLQAANLDSRKTDLTQSRQSVALTEERLEAAKEVSASKKKIAESAREEYEGAKRLEGLEQEVTKLSTIVAWAEFAQKEEECKRLKEIVDSAGGKRAELNGQLEELQAEKSALDEQLNALEREHEGLLEKRKQLSQQGEEEVKATKAMKKQKKKLVEAKNQCNAETELLEKAKSDLEVAIKEVKQGLQARQQQMKDEAEQKWKENEERSHSVDEQYKDLQKNMYKFEEAQQEAEQRATDARNRAGSTEVELKNEKNSLNALQSSNGNKLELLDQKMPALVNLIAKHKTKFKSPPIGPLGQLLRVKDKFSHLEDAAEVALARKQGLTSFIVQHSEDETLLRGLINTIPGQLQSVLIFVRKEEPRFVCDLPKVDGTAPLLIELFDIESDAAYNLVCDYFKGARTLIFPTLEEASEAMFKKLRTVQNIQAFAGTNHDVFRLAVKGAAATGKGGTEAVEPRDKAIGLLHPDNSKAIQAATLRVSQLTDTHDKALAEAKELKQEWDKTKSAEAAAKKKATSLKKEMDGLRDQKRKLEAEGVKDAADDELYPLTQELHSTTAKLLENASSEREISSKIAKLEAQLLPAEKQTKELLAKFQAAEKNLTDKAREIEELKRTQLKKRTSRIAELKRNINQENEDAATASKDLERQLAFLRDQEPEIEEYFGKRMDDEKGRSVEQLNKDLEKLEHMKKIAERKHGGRTLVELFERMNAAESHHLKGLENIEIVRGNAEAEKKAFETRLKLLKKDILHKSSQAKSDFNMRLTRKGHAGSLEFEHDEEQLALSVTRNNQDTSCSTTQDARSLSGGERSFTTLCFELAMWEFCAAPFRALDEFDVYMDDTYRKIAVDALMELCEAQPRRQFLFITPQDMHPFLIDKKKMPNIIKMKNVR